MKRKLKRNLTNEIYTYLPIISLTYLIHHLHCALLHYTSINNSSLLDNFQTGKKNENKILSLLFASKYSRDGWCWVNQSLRKGGLRWRSHQYESPNVVTAQKGLRWIFCEA